MAVNYVLAESLVPITDDVDYDNIMIGNSRFTDDIWDLRPFIAKKTTIESHKYLRFEYIQNDNMKFTVKQYAYYKLGTVKPQTVQIRVNGHLPNFIEYCLLNGINRFTDITQDDFLDFNIWQREIKKISVSTGYQCSFVVEDIVKPLDKNPII